MKKMWSSLMLVFCCFSLTATAKEQDNWLRIDNPSQELRRQMSGVAIEYDHFLWLSENQLPQNSSISDASVHVIAQPFHVNIDNQRIDLNDAQLPNNIWFQDLSLGRSSGSTQLYIVQFKGPIKAEWLTALQAENVQLIKPLAPFSWIVLANPEQRNSLSQLPALRSVSYMYSAFRVATVNRNLDSAILPTMALVVTDQLQDSQNTLIQLGAIIDSTVTIDKNLSAINFSLSGSQYQAAAAIPGLLTIQKVATDGGPRGEMSQQSVVGAFNNNLTVAPGYQSWLTAAGVNGNGVTVGVVDGGIQNNHPDLVGQFAACSGSGPSCGNSTDTHGTHVAGAIGGTGVNNSMLGGFNRGLGVAPGVHIVEQLYAPLMGSGPGGMVAGGMLSIFKDSQTSGVLLANNSWGPSGTPQGYDIPTMELDMIARDANPDIPGNQPVMPVWSIMNGNGDSGGSCAPSSLGAPDEAKNLFAVGSTKLQRSNGSQQNALFDVSSNSGHGPACDGRLVPHIVAPGCYTDAPLTSTGYGMNCGTSMASPVVSGAVALYWQQYKNNHGVDPSSALIKALFTVKADDLNGYNDADGHVMSHAPNRKQGWGRLNLDTIINPANAVWLKDQQVMFSTSGEQWSVPLVAENPNEPVKVMLVWTDAPGFPSGTSTPAWVNDLDLMVKNNNNTYLGNQFAGNGFSTTGGSPDEKNNMEAVFLNPAQHQGNRFTIQVMAANIMGDALNPHNPSTNRQDFALVCDNCQILADLIFENGFELSDLIFKDGFE
ncbi:S8 family serine peptidase [Marinicella gelatinilytica]|uniref:S8 family serine peptidase n=1 Tax=Marinicella gelatinilytica TaxID=2996017 RepID=UPI002260B5BC|nr:S8 family serine peptidase [Marinicella gelatinilytica]MCX7544422.1 S8 family serine peptidase [Marinicella gelatinilytica]